jgi:hypothetical protein
MAPRASYDAYDAPRTQSRVGFEVILGSALLALGLFVVPAGVYLVGQALLGPYGDAAAGSAAAGIGTFYANFFGDLASFSGRAWALALGPLALVSWVRLLFLRRSDSDDARNDVPPPRSAPRQQPRAEQPRAERPRPRGEAGGRRVEPRIS